MSPQPQTAMAQCVCPPGPNNHRAVRLLTTKQEYMSSTPPSQDIPMHVSPVSSYLVRSTRVRVHQIKPTSPYKIRSKIANWYLWWKK